MRKALTPPAYELPCASGPCFCRRDPGGDFVLFAEAEAGGEAGFKHFAVATIPGRNPGERPVPKAKKELAADPADHSIDTNRPGFIAAILCSPIKTSGAEGRDPGRVRVNAG